MGRTKSRIGRNYEKLKRVGRPAKKYCTSTHPAETAPVSVTALSDLTNSPLPSNQWTVQNHLPDNVIFCKMSSQLSSDRQSLSVTHCLTISSDFSWTLSVHGMKVDPSVCPLIRKIPTKLNNKPTLQQLMSLLENSMICQTNDLLKRSRQKKVNFCQGMARQWQE